jgi:hypothetical protein
MREAHQMMIDSLKLQMETFNKELQHIRNTRYVNRKIAEFTSNAYLRTRSALSHRSAVFGLLANYLFTQFQKVK